MTCGIGFLISFLYLVITKSWKKLKYPWYVWAIGSSLIVLSEIGYIAAFHFAPAAYVDLINYLWPVLVVSGIAFFPNESFRISYLFSQVFGFLAIWVLFYQSSNEVLFTQEKIIGYLLALMGALCWAAYILFTRRFGNVSTQMMGMYLGVTSLVCLLLHIPLEVSVTNFNFLDIAIILIMGIGMDGLAYLFWDQGMKRGNFKLLSIMSYFTPVASVSLLVFFGFVTATWKLYFSCCLLIISMGIFTISEKLHEKSLAHQK